MRIEEIKKVRQQLYQIAAKHGISKVYVFGSVARGESSDVSNVISLSRWMMTYQHLVLAHFSMKSSNY